MKNIKIYTDGSSLGNPGPSGWCALLEYSYENKIHYTQISGSEENSTGAKMELLAVIKGLELIIEPCQITIISDSAYVCNGINIYLPNWISNQFRRNKHADLWQKFVELSKNHKIVAEWIKAHNNHPQNEHCDRIAKANAEIAKNKNLKNL